jgi:hypothetical protein
LTGSEGPMVGQQTIQREELNGVEERRELGQDCGPRRSFQEPGTRSRFPVIRLRSAFAVLPIG